MTGRGVPHAFWGRRLGTSRPMSVREVVRRTGVWALVAGYLAACIVTIVATGDVWTLLAWCGFAVVGAILLTVRARSWIGVIMLVVGVYWGVAGPLYNPAVAAATPVWIELGVLALSPVVWVMVPLLLTLFPDDRVTTRFGTVNIVAIVIVAATVFAAQVFDPQPLQLSGRPNPLGIAALGPITGSILSEVTFAIVPLLLVSTLVDLILRWRRSHGARRLQFRWIAYGGAITIVILLIAVIFPVLPDPVGILIVVGFNAIPVTVFIALTRHGLYEVDRVISRTVSYAIVTALAAAVYVVVVTSVTWVLPDAPSIAVAAATLAAAALFLPVLRGVRRVVDRRFDRQAYDAVQVVDDFGIRLRTEIDVAQTSDALVGAVRRALRPDAVGLWARGAGR